MRPMKGRTNRPLMVRSTFIGDVMFAAKKWIVQMASFALLAGLGQFARGADTASATPAATATVTVTVVDSNAKPVEGAMVRLMAATPRHKKGGTQGADNAAGARKHRKHAKPVAEGKTDQDGKAVLSNVADGSYVVNVHMKEVGNGRKKVTVADGKDVSASVTLKERKHHHKSKASAAAPAEAK